MAVEAGQPVIVTGVDMAVLLVRPDDLPVPAQLAGDVHSDDPLARPMADPFDDVNG